MGKDAVRSRRKRKVKLKEVTSSFEVSDIEFVMWALSKNIRSYSSSTFDQTPTRDVTVITIPSEDWWMVTPLIRNEIQNATASNRKLYDLNVFMRKPLLILQQTAMRGNVLSKIKVALKYFHQTCQRNRIGGIHIESIIAIFSLCS